MQRAAAQSDGITLILSWFLAELRAKAQSCWHSPSLYFQKIFLRTRLKYIQRISSDKTINTNFKHTHKKVYCAFATVKLGNVRLKSGGALNITWNLTCFFFHCNNSRDKKSIGSFINVLQFHSKPLKRNGLHHLNFRKFQTKQHRFVFQKELIRFCLKIYYIT